MKFEATIFVEGKADEKFMRDFVMERFNYPLKPKVEIKQTKGKDSLSDFKNDFNSNPFTNLVIFDADESFHNRQSEITGKKQGLSIDFNLFLFPNNSDDGDLEILLRRIIRTTNEPIFDCFKILDRCLEAIQGKMLHPLNAKTRIHNYVSILTDDNDLAKERNRNYRNKDHWDLQHDHLNTLFTFLEPYFKE